MKYRVDWVDKQIVEAYSIMEGDSFADIADKINKGETGDEMLFEGLGQPDWVMTTITEIKE